MNTLSRALLAVLVLGLARCSGCGGSEPPPRANTMDREAMQERKEKTFDDLSREEAKDKERKADQ